MTGQQLNFPKKHLEYYTLILAIFSLFIFAFLPALSLWIEKWSSSEDYDHAFFVVPLILYISWKERQPLIQNKSFSMVGLVFLVMAIYFYFLSLKIEVPTFIFASTIAALISGIIYLGGFQSLKAFSIPILLLIMLIPIPNQILSMLTGTLQLQISMVGETIIRTFGVPMLREGNVLHVQGMSFQVIEACSGIRSLISLTTLSVIIGYFSLSRPSSKALLFVFSIPIAIFINLIRVVTLVLVYYFFRMDLSTGTPHTMIGLILFILGFALLFTGQRALESWEQKRKNI